MALNWIRFWLSKNIYLRRSITSAFLWCLGVIIFSFTPLGFSFIHPFWAYVPFAILGIMFTKSMTETFVNKTGFGFFISFYGLGLIFTIGTVLGILIGPLYSIWNFLKYRLTINH